MFPTISVLLPTYGRPTMLTNTIACFLAQDYPKSRCHLTVLDDLGTIRGLNIDGHSDTALDSYTATQLNVHNIRIHSTRNRFKSLPEKYNALWQIARPADIYVVFEDDDIYLPWHLSTHAKALELRGWSHPSLVWSDYGNAWEPMESRLHTEGSSGRFHASIAMTSRIMEKIGGWPQTRRADFDQQLLGVLRSNGEPADPMQFCPSSAGLSSSLTGDMKLLSQYSTIPSYLFRWHTSQPHGQGFMAGPDDESWYDKYVPTDTSGPHTISPALDDITRSVYTLLGA